MAPVIALVALLFLLAVTTLGYVQQAPPNVLKKDYRQNFCKLLHKVQNNNITGYSVLKGRTIHVGYNRDGSNHYTTNAAAYPYRPTSGFLVSLFEEFARRGQFHVNYVLTPNLTTYKSSTAFVQGLVSASFRPQELPLVSPCMLPRHQVPYMDLLAGQPIGDIAARRQLGYGVLDGVADFTVVLVAKLNVTPPVFKLWAFLEPFQNVLWGWIAGLVFFHALLYYIIERVERRVAGAPKEEVISLTLPNATFQALGDLAQADTYVSPTGLAGKILRTGWGLFLVIIVSSYTANLTSFLIVRPPVKYTVENIDDANLRSQTLCMRYGSSTVLSLVQSAYPAVIPYLVQTADVNEVCLFFFFNVFGCLLPRLVVQEVTSPLCPCVSFSGWSICAN
jgi:hypothetical protein